MNREPRERHEKEKTKKNIKKEIRKSTKKVRIAGLEENSNAPTSVFKLQDCL